MDKFSLKDSGRGDSEAGDSDYHYPEGWGQELEAI